jgi:hypothetical protein
MPFQKAVMSGFFLCSGSNFSVNVLSSGIAWMNFGVICQPVKELKQIVHEHRKMSRRKTARVGKFGGTWDNHISPN